jgi:hypothetical protein
MRKATISIAVHRRISNEFMEIGVVELRRMSGEVGVRGRQVPSTLITSAGAGRSLSGKVRVGRAIAEVRVRERMEEPDVDVRALGSFRPQRDAVEYLELARTDPSRT